MIGYLTLGTNDLERAAAFYDPLLALIGAERQLVTDRVIHWGKPGRLGSLALVKPHDGEPATVGNGSMVALSVRNTAMVDEVHRHAIAMGAPNEGDPGVRTKTFYGAYFRDPDGNKLCVFTFVK